MAVIGRNISLRLAGSSTGGGHNNAPRAHGFLDSLTHSLDLACRGYLCAPLVDCDPRTDPECGPAGKKPLIPHPAHDGLGHGTVLGPGLSAAEADSMSGPVSGPADPRHTSA
jgi:hypothetical protein